jgi:hypothetical protein
MDEGQQQRLNQAAEQFTGALVEQLRTVSDRTVEAQDQGLALQRTSSTEW